MAFIRVKEDLMDSKENEGISEERTSMPLVVNEEVYHDNLIDGQQCFVLVDQETVEPIPSISSPSHHDVPNLMSGYQLQTTNNIHSNEDADYDEDVDDRDIKITDQQRSINIMADEKDELDMMGIESGRTVEVVEMDDGETVEVVQMDGGKTLEVMHVDDIDASHKVTQYISNVIPTKVSDIHLENKILCDSSIQTEVINDPIIENIDLSEQEYRKVNKTLPSQISNEGITPVTMKTVYTFRNKNQLISSPLNLSTISSPTPSITFSTGKTMYAAKPAYSVNNPIVVSSSISKNSLLNIKSRIPEANETGIRKSTSSAEANNYTMKSLTQSNRHTRPNIVLSGGKPVVSDTLENLSNTIIISWPSSLPSEDQMSMALNEKSIQTEPSLVSSSSGPSMNIFSCTFYPNCDAETLCDMPVQRNIGVGTQTYGIKRHVEVEDDFDRKGRIYTEKGQLNIRRNMDDCSSKNELSASEEIQDEEIELDQLSVDEQQNRETKHYNLMHSPENMDQQQHDLMMKLPIKKRKKRGRKKKKKDPTDTMRDLEEELEFACREIDAIPNDVDTNEEADEGGGEHEVKDVPRSKGYGLRTKRRLKKLSDMHYLEERVPKKRIERSQVFNCPLCEESFPTFTRLQKHSKDNHDSTTFEFPCDICGIIFTRPHNLERHKATKHSGGEKRFVCEHCGRRFGRQDVLSVHISMVHLKTLLNNSNNNSNKKNKGPSLLGPSMVHCTSCNKFFAKETKLKEHMSGDLTCTDCNVKFECKTSLRNHIYKDHQSSCSECGKECSNKQQMYFHRLSHSPKFFCKICKKGFLWKSTYSVHMATHTGEKPELCDICGKSFSHKVAVNKHKWQEHNENNRKFVCPTCGKAFVYKTKLASHIRSHTGEKPFMCNHCPASFSQKCNLTAHIKCVHGVYIQSIKTDGSTETQLVKYKRVKKLPVTDTVINPIMQQTQEQEQVHNMASQVQEQVQRISHQVHHNMDIADSEHEHEQVHEQVHISEVMEPETAVYQIVYTYPP